MAEPLYIFLFAGIVSMSAALSAGALNKLALDQRPAFMQKPNGQITVIMAGNLGAITLLGAMAFGFLKLHWWIPLSCMFITFPIVHLLVFQRILGDLKSLIVMLPLTVVAAVALYYYW
ncbi:hypothetical protein ADIMK_1773 [Marinobacterium lacunae]|uniref:Uncharacterized protein n=1 Tax=Marinobacterium lacunae TaxID=1232683 RepID=A0A081FZT3_9GAMM|nr:hypothetical protein [Marinobacterium lacunae]KEA64038.1 hypothetical protein ADIMK_1773 [Marinobacterium lacunae]MBR9885194.1 hypothetical protein [Oceanospirillales bacterium]